MRLVRMILGLLSGGDDDVFRESGARSRTSVASEHTAVEQVQTREALEKALQEIKQRNEALRASERNLNLIINTIPALAWSAGPDGSADFFNQHYLEFVGLSAEQVKDWGWTAAVHPDDLNGLAGSIS
jgi:PAS domain-containing protein